MITTDEKQRKLPIRVDLDEEDAKKFKAVQKKFKLKNKAEMLRFCVTDPFTRRERYSCSPT